MENCLLYKLYNFIILDFNFKNCKNFSKLFFWYYKNRTIKIDGTSSKITLTKESGITID